MTGAPGSTAEAGSVVVEPPSSELVPVTTDHQLTAAVAIG